MKTATLESMQADPASAGAAAVLPSIFVQPTRAARGLPSIVDLLAADPSVDPALCRAIAKLNPLGVVRSEPTGHDAAMRVIGEALVAVKAIHQPSFDCGEVLDLLSDAQVALGEVFYDDGSGE